MKSCREQEKTKKYKIKKLRNVRIETWKTFEPGLSYQEVFDYKETDGMNVTEQPLKSFSESSIRKDFKNDFKNIINDNDNIASTSYNNENKDKELYYTSPDILTMITPNVCEFPKKKQSPEELKKSQIAKKISENYEPEPKSNDNQFSNGKEISVLDNNNLQNFSTFIKSTNYEKFEEIAIHCTSKSFYEVKKIVSSNDDNAVDALKEECQDSRESPVCFENLDAFSQVKSVGIVKNSKCRIEQSAKTHSASNYSAAKKQSQQAIKAATSCDKNYHCYTKIISDLSTKKKSKPYNIVDEVYKLINQSEKYTHTDFTAPTENKTTSAGEICEELVMRQDNIFTKNLPFINCCDAEMNSDFKFIIESDKTTQDFKETTVPFMNTDTMEDCEVQADFKLPGKDMGTNTIQQSSYAVMLDNILKHSLNCDTVEELHIEKEEFGLEELHLQDDFQNIHTIETMGDDQKKTKKVTHEIYATGDHLTKGSKENSNQLESGNKNRTLLTFLRQYVVNSLLEGEVKENLATDDELITDRVNNIRTVSFPKNEKISCFVMTRRSLQSLRNLTNSASTSLKALQKRSLKNIKHTASKRFQMLQIHSLFTKLAKKDEKKDEKQVLPSAKNERLLIRSNKDTWKPSAEDPNVTDVGFESPRRKKHQDKKGRDRSKTRKKKVPKNNVGVQTIKHIEHEEEGSVKEFAMDSMGPVTVAKEKHLLENQTGMFLDGRRRVDMVIVMKNFKEDRRVETIKINFLIGLVKTGLELEAEDGVFHKHLTFIKLHATDTLLKTYADAFGVSSPFRHSHARSVNPASNQGRWNMLSFEHEGEWLASIRSNYKKPLQLSNYQRSYIVQMILLYLSFGDNKNYYGLERLINKGIIADAYALHDGPYQKYQPNEFSTVGQFNARQILYTTWSGCANAIRGQPLHIIFEYFGPKMGFYFTFYEFYNKMLFIASIWGVLMMIIYRMVDYLQPVRDHCCSHIDMTNSSFLADYFDKKPRLELVFYAWHTVICSECEGSNKTSICPYTLVQHYCLDLKIMKLVDSPFMILYSFGISFLILLFLALWNRVQAYWSWMYGDNEMGVARRLIRPSYAIGRQCRSIHLFEIFKSLIFDYFVPIMAIMFPMMLVFSVFLVGYEGSRALSTKDKNCTIEPKEGKRDQKIVTPELDKVKEYAVLVSQVIYLHLLLYVIEKLLHFGSYYLTKLENHKTYASFEKCLILCFFWISCHYTFDATVYFAWIKGAFFHSPIAHWDVAFNVTYPWGMVTYNMSEILPEFWSKILRITFSMNCGPFSCFRQGVVVYCVLVIFRVGIVGLLDILYRYIQTALNESRTSCMTKNNVIVPTSEREYLLLRFSERQLIMNYNSLFLQFAMVILFSPLMPLAPLLALLVNLWDLRYKAHLYVVHYRRIIMHKSAGIGAWNHILRMLCCAVPLLHAISVARTDIFQKYIFEKVYSRKMIPVPIIQVYDPYKTHNRLNQYNWRYIPSFIRFLFYANYVQTNPAHNNHERFTKMNHDRVHMGDPEKAKVANWIFVDKATGVANYILSFRCHLYGYFQETRLRDGFKYTKTPFTDMRWPFEYNFIESNNYSYFAPAPHHYEWHFYKTSYVLFSTIFFAFVALCLNRYLSEIPSKLERFVFRERQLLRLKNVRMSMRTPPEKKPTENNPFEINPSEMDPSAPSAD